MTTTKRISVDQVHALLARMGLPVVVDAETESEGFRARAWGGRGNGRLVKAAESVEVFYRYSRYRAVTSSDLRNLPEIRDHFQWAVDKAPQYGYSIDWNPNRAMMHVTRASS